MSDPRGPGDAIPAGMLTDFGPAEFLVEPLPAPPSRAGADDPFAALKAMSDEERIALFT